MLACSVVRVRDVLALVLCITRLMRYALMLAVSVRVRVQRWVCVGYVLCVGCSVSGVVMGVGC